MITFHRLNILDDAGSNRAMQQTLCDDSSLSIWVESWDLIFDRGRSGLVSFSMSLRQKGKLIQTRKEDVY